MRPKDVILFQPSWALSYAKRLNKGERKKTLYHDRQNQWLVTIAVEVSALNSLPLNQSPK